MIARRLLQLALVLLASLALLPLAGNAQSESSDGDEQHTFVLVQGAWVGSWYWREVADILRAKGHRVFTPSLTGLGSRAHLLSADIHLSTHVQDITTLVEAEQLDDIVLVGHSYGGMVISGATANLPEGTVKALVYLDAFYPESGQSMVDIVGEEAAALVYGNADPIPPPIQIFADDPSMAAGLERSTPHPRKTKFERLGDLSRRDTISTKVFIVAANAAGGFLDAAFEKLSADPAWITGKIATGHNMMAEAPDATAEILLRAVNQ